MFAKLLAPQAAAAMAGALLVLVWGGCSSKRGATRDGQPSKPAFTLFALAETRGQIGPCGCTTDPLGDLSRTAALVEQARREGPVLVVDAGGLLYSQAKITPELAAQEELKADLLVKSYQESLGVAAIGLGSNDLAQGPARVRPGRQVANLAAEAGVALEEPKIVVLGTAKVGVFGVATPASIEGLPLTDPVAAGQRAAGGLRAQGAELVVALIQATSKAEAMSVAAAIGGLDLVVAGLGGAAPEPDRVEPSAEPLRGGGFLVIPANRGQVVSRVEVTLREGGGLTDALGRAAAASRDAQLAQQLQSVEADLVRFAADPSADPAFVATKKQEVTRLQEERAQLARAPLRVPAKGSYFTLEQVKISKQLACHAQVQTDAEAYFRAAGEANVRFAQSVPAVPPPKGVATYVGTQACVECHDTAVEFWKKSRHADAWQTLVERGQEYDLECISCHVTGWNKPGGATLAKNEALRDVQCEVCHGPASIHVAKEGDDEPRTLTGGPEPELCAKLCHTKEHSDTFSYDAYLRDIVGPGHGEERRKALGDGPTGHELRAAGLERAGKTLGAGCKK
ncbi:MAG: multiheme c-type cytochrome [Kofleriaceae bacterium]